MQISFVMLLFSDQISGRGKSFQGGQTVSGGRPLPPPPACERKPAYPYILQPDGQYVFCSTRNTGFGAFVSDPDLLLVADG